MKVVGNSLVLKTSAANNTLGKYHFLPPGGGAPGIWGEHMNFGNQKGEQKNFTDPIQEELKSQNINLYWKNVT